MSDDGRLAPEFRALMAGSSHLVILPVKILAIVSGLSVKSLTPFTLNASAIGPTTIGRSSAGPPHRLAAAATSPLSGLSAESEPAKSTWLPLTCLPPAPDPVAL